MCCELAKKINSSRMLSPYVLNVMCRERESSVPFSENVVAHWKHSCFNWSTYFSPAWIAEVYFDQLRHVFLTVPVKVHPSTWINSYLVAYWKENEVSLIYSLNLLFVTRVAVLHYQEWYHTRDIGSSPQYKEAHIFSTVGQSIFCD